MIKKVICIGNRFAYPDNFGMRIYDKLQKNNTLDIELVEGGIGGLNLALHFESDAPILVVDHGCGFEKNLLHIDELSLDFINEYNHDTAFYYLLKSLKKRDIWIYLSNNKDWNEDMLDDSITDIIKNIEEL